MRHERYHAPVPPRYGLSRKLAAVAATTALLLLGTLSAFRLWGPRVVEHFAYTQSRATDNTLLYDTQGRFIASLEGLENRRSVSIRHIHPNLLKSVVAVEDHRFFAHRGLDPIRIAGALLNGLRDFEFRQGGSTITQQLVKLSILSPERTISRKMQELFMALALEQGYTKEELLEAYLNRVYFGYGLYGVEQAAQAYFRKTAHELTLNEAAFLAALIKKPEGYLRSRAIVRDEFLHLEQFPALHRRQRQILHTLYTLGWIPMPVYRQSLYERWNIYRPSPELRAAPYFVEGVRKQLRQVLGVQAVAGRGYRVYTTLDVDLQAAAEDTLGQMHKEMPESRELALISLDSESGAVRSLVGGVDFTRSQFNHATQAQRQPGSAFKPILYATALEHGWQPNAVFLDIPLEYRRSQAGTRITLASPSDLDGESPEGRSFAERVSATFAPATFSGSAQGMQYSSSTPQYGEAGGALDEEIYGPRNVHERYGLSRVQGHPPADPRMTLQRALERSSNVIAVQLLHRIGLSKLAQQARRWGVPLRAEAGLCVALGCSELTLSDLTSAYASFANGGLRVRPFMIERVLDAQGNELYQRPPVQEERVLSAWSAFRIRQMLSGVLRWGTGWRARTAMPSGGKTGTNDGPRDAWFVGFTPELVSGVWMGHDDNQVMPGASGGGHPALIWRRYMERVGQTQARFPEPEQPHVLLNICHLDGRLVWEGCPDAGKMVFLLEDAQRMLTEQQEAQYKAREAELQGTMRESFPDPPKAVPLSQLR